MFTIISFLKWILYNHILSKMNYLQSYYFSSEWLEMAWKIGRKNWQKNKNWFSPSLTPQKSQISQISQMSQLFCNFTCQRFLELYFELKLSLFMCCNMDYGKHFSKYFKGKAFFYKCSFLVIGLCYKGNKSFGTDFDKAAW